MNETETKEYPVDRFLGRITEAVRADDRGYLAEVRRGLNANTREQAWQHVIPYCAKFEDETVRTVWCTFGGIAATILKAGLNGTEQWHNMGTTMRKLATGEKKGEDGLKTFEPKFRRLLSCNDAISLCAMVTGIAKTAETKGVQINLKRLFWDMTNWSDDAKREDVKLRWAKQYFRADYADGEKGVDDEKIS